MASDDFSVRLGSAIAMHRRAKRLTQEQLAEQLDVSTEWLSQVERGIGLPSLELLTRLGAALQVTTAQLVEAAEDAPSGRRAVQDLMARARSLPEPAIELLIDVAKSLAARWPRP